MRKIFKVLFLLLLTGTTTLVSAQELNFIYKKGQDGYSCFRIPAIVTTTKGTVLAFAEGRRDNCGDAGDIDLVVKRSFDGGNTWGPLQVIWNDSTNTCGNPAPVIDKRTGNIILLSTWNLGSDHEKAITAQTSTDTRRVYVISSSDDGNTWTKPVEITKQVKLPAWTWYATGPGAGAQITQGKYKGRLVIGCDHLVGGSKISYSHAIYSDDGGKTWVLGGTAPNDKVNESTVAEAGRGKLILNMRNSAGIHQRQVALSRDGAKTWQKMHPDPVLIEPGCEGSLLYYNYPKAKKALVFANPASTTSRSNMTVRLSFDKGRSWPLSKKLYAGPSAYSDLTLLPDGSIGCLFEAGYLKPYDGIVFKRVELKDFTK
ncbi:MAG: sialidase family protein [Ginsengibacter sp.]